MPGSLTPDALHEVYAAIGAAVWHLQFLEDVVVTYLTMRLRLTRPVDRDQAFAILANERRKTLGTHFTAAKAGGVVEGDLAEAFEALLQDRNWLVHRAMLESSDRLYREDGRAVFLSRVRQLTDDAIDLKKRVYEDVRRWCAEEGVDIAMAEALGQRNFNAIRDA